jgi:hypothetical protein
MADLVVFVGLVGLVGAVGIALGMLAARRLDAWDERRATAADGVRATPAPASAVDGDLLEDGGETVD